MFPPKECSGCGACVNLCPVKAIRFVKNGEGFYYPTVDKDLCILCGMCEKKCPVLSPCEPMKTRPGVYALQNRDEIVRFSSTSGGVFTLLAEHVLRQNGIVVGCAMSEDCYSAEHVIVSDRESLSVLRGSKYVQSRVDHLFPDIRDALAEGKTVLFSGTPCQVAGLSAFLSQSDTERLILVDIVCHGTPSPAVWEKYVRHWETVRGSRAVSVEFRNKDHGWKTYSLVITFENGDVYRGACTEDLYCRGFVADYFLRGSCYDCRSKGEHRSSDITLGDLWGIGRVCSEMDDNRGTSLVLVNTEKGEALLREIKGASVCRSVDMEEATNHNPSYWRSSSRKAYRNHFMKRLAKKPILKLLNSYCSTGLIFRIKRKLIGLMAR